MVESHDGKSIAVWWDHKSPVNKAPGLVRMECRWGKDHAPGTALLVDLRVSWTSLSLLGKRFRVALRSAELRLKIEGGCAPTERQSLANEPALDVRVVGGVRRAIDLTQRLNLHDATAFLVASQTEPVLELRASQDGELDVGPLLEQLAVVRREEDECRVQASFVARRGDIRLSTEDYREYSPNVAAVLKILIRRAYGIQKWLCHQELGYGNA